jgi:chromosomal replication initiation ATPase DnaA
MLKLREMMTTSHFKVSRHKVVDVPNEYVDSEDGQLSSQFTPYEIKKLKELVHNSFIPYPNALRKNGLMDLCIKVCKYYNITVDDFKSSKRDRYLVIARLDFCHLVKKNNNYFATTSVGRFMNRDHTTVLYYLKKQPVNLEKINAETY